MIFDILPCFESESLRKALYFRNDVPARRVIIGTKGAGLLWSILAINSFRGINNAQFVIFSMPAKKRILLDLYLIIYRIFFRKKVSIIYLQYLLPTGYNEIIASCSHLMLQRRGGASTARL